MESRGIYMSYDVATAKGEATSATRHSATEVKAVDDLGNVAGRIRAQVDQFFEKLHAA